MNIRSIFSKDRKLVRMISLMKILEQRPENLEHCAFVLRVSVRTLQRDIKMLKLAGFPITCNPETLKYQMNPSRKILPIDFSQMEVLTLLALVDSYGKKSEEPVFSTMRTIGLKLSLFLSPAFFDIITDLGNNLIFRRSSLSAVQYEDEHIQDLLQAVEHRHKVRFAIKVQAIWRRLLPFYILIRLSSDDPGT